MRSVEDQTGKLKRGEERRGERRKGERKYYERRRVVESMHWESEGLCKTTSDLRSRLHQLFLEEADLLWGSPRL